MKGILEVDILEKVSYTKIIAKASIAATRAETAGGDAQTAKLRELRGGQGFDGGVEAG